MRIVLTLLVRDEADIMQAMLDYHFATGVGYVVATDNLSHDSTAEILGRYAAQG